MKRRTAWTLVAGVAAPALGAPARGAIALLLRGRSHGPALGRDAYLALDLTGEIPEEAPSEVGFLIRNSPPSLRGLVESLDRAARDPKIKGALVRIGPLPDS